MIRIGKGIHGGTVVGVDLGRLIESRLLIQANSGGGKSFAIRRLLEVTHGQCQQIVLDVEDEFHTLREKYDFVLAGRQGGDCPADVRSASLLARKLLELGASALIGIYELKAHDRIRFVRLFLESLISAPRNLWHPAMIVVDEAHLFAPQHGTAESAAAVIDLMTRGRKRGFCGILATQRISKLHKDAAAEANNKLIGRSALDIDMKRAADELGLSSRDEQNSLRSLLPGHFYAFGPAICEKVTEMIVDAVVTTHPKAGERATPTPPPRGEIKKLLAQLADIPKEVEAELVTVEQLKARVRDLEAELRTAKKPQLNVDPTALKAAEGRGYQAGLKQWFALKPHLTRLQAEAEKLDASVVKLQESIGLQNIKIFTNRQPLTTVKTTQPIIQTTEASLDLPPARQRILDGLSWLECIGISQADRVQLAFFADQSPRSSGYANNLGALRTAGLIQYPSGSLIALTDEGRSKAKLHAKPPTPADLHAMIERKLPSAKWRILNVLIESYPNQVEREELATRSDQSSTSSGYANNLGSLRSLGLIEYPTRGSAKAAAILFLE